mgnify:CR=1 FL=1
MKKTEITTTDELARLHKKVTEDLNAVSKVKSLLGGSCFTLNAEKRILAENLPQATELRWIS